MTRPQHPKLALNKAIMRMQYCRQFFFKFFQDEENPGDLLASSRIHSSQKLIHLGPLTISSLVTHSCSAVTFDILSMQLKYCDLYYEPGGACSLMGCELSLVVVVVIPHRYLICKLPELTNQPIGLPVTYIFTQS